MFLLACQNHRSQLLETGWLVEHGVSSVPRTRLQLHVRALSGSSYEEERGASCYETDCRSEENARSENTTESATENAEGTRERHRDAARASCCRGHRRCFRIDGHRNGSRCSNIAITLAQSKEGGRGEAGQDQAKVHGRTTAAKLLGDERGRAFSVRDLRDSKNERAGHLAGGARHAPARRVGGRAARRSSSSS